MNGKRMIHYIDGNRYEGEFKNGGNYRKGKFYWENGNKYDGEFKNN